MKIGMIGLGAMGSVMARRLAAAGHCMHVFDIVPEAVERLRHENVLPATSPRAMAGECELILSLIWDDAALEQTVFGPDGILAEPGFAGCFIDLSTTSVEIARRVGEAFDRRGACFLDGAVIGGGVPAASAGRSPIVIAGDPAAFSRHLPVLDILGQCDHVGEQGAAKIVKVINNHIVGVMTGANAETLSIGMSAGLEIDALFAVLRHGLASSTVLESYIGRYLAEGRYGDGLIGHDLMHKDITLARELAESVHHPAPFATLAQQFYIACGQLLGGQASFPTSLEYFRHLAEAGPQRGAGSPASS